jgi:hypothetical protein
VTLVVHIDRLTMAEHGSSSSRHWCLQELLLLLFKLLSLLYN